VGRMDTGAGSSLLGDLDTDNSVIKYSLYLIIQDPIIVSQKSKIS